MTHPHRKLNPQQKIIYTLSERLVKAQKPIRILDAIKGMEKFKIFSFVINLKGYLLSILNFMNLILYPLIFMKN